MYAYLHLFSLLLTISRSGKADDDLSSFATDEADENTSSNAPTPMSLDKPATSTKAPVNAVVFSPELLRVYYSRLFPFDFMFSWLSYGNDPSAKLTNGNDPSYFARREWSFTIQPTPTDEIYIRYQSFKNEAELRAAVTKRQPNKIDIGAVFTHKPDQHKTLKSDVFHTVERELVFDIDLTVSDTTRNHPLVPTLCEHACVMHVAHTTHTSQDYDCVRTCCTGANICNRCWTYMNCAVKTVDEGLRTDFGFDKIAWFYSGRRGVHCWVADKKARQLSNEGRSAVATYFELPLENQEKSLELTPNLHPMLRRSFETLEPIFLNSIIGEDGMKVSLRTSDDGTPLFPQCMVYCAWLSHEHVRSSRTKKVGSSCSRPCPRRPGPPASPPRSTRSGPATTVPRSRSGPTSRRSCPRL